MFLGNWNEYFYAALLTSSEKNRTLPVCITVFNQSLSYDYTKMFAALTLVVVPAIIVYYFAQEQVQESVAASGIKRLIKENEAMPVMDYRKEQGQRQAGSLRRPAFREIYWKM